MGDCSKFNLELAAAQLGGNKVALGAGSSMSSRRVCAWCLDDIEAELSIMATQCAWCRRWHYEECFVAWMQGVGYLCPLR